MNPLEKLVVAAEFNGAYLWIKPSCDRSSWVGLNVSDAQKSVPMGYGVSASLEADFRSWIEKWESTVLPRVEYEEIAPTSFWSEINDEGLVLARRLKAEIGERYEIEYHPPYEDPERGGNDALITLILSDGSLSTYPPTEKKQDPLR